MTTRIYLIGLMILLLTSCAPAAETPEAAVVSPLQVILVSADFAVGDVLYGIPWHVCPTVALHQEAVVIGENGEINGRWPIVARNRRLTI